MENQQLKLEKTKIHLETLRQLIVARYNIIFTSSMLVAAILAIATLSPQILGLSLQATKILVIILLGIIPIALIDYSLKISKDSNHVMNVLYKMWGVQSHKKSYFQKFFDGSSYLYVCIITLLISFVIYSIAKTLDLF